MGFLNNAPQALVWAPW